MSSSPTTVTATSKGYQNGDLVKYLYDQGRRLTSSETKNKNQAILQSFGWGYDSLDLKSFEKRLHNGGKGDAFSYDALKRLTNVTFDSPTPETPGGVGVKSRAITLDKLDNILKITDNENAMVTEIIGELEGKGKALNQYSRFNDLPLEYDTNGNLSAKGSRLFSYDYRNRLIRSSKGDDAVTFTYDIFGRQTSRTDLSGTLHFFYAGDQKIEERNASGQVTKHYLWGNGIDELLRLDIYNGSSSTPYYIHTDNIGSTTAITDGSGNLVERVTYDGYGLPTFTDALGQTLKKSTIRNTTLFQGREYDYDLALYNYRARYLDPSLGRFLQTDPLGYQDSMNLYQGMGMNPVNFVDPRGKEVVRAELGKHDVFATQRFKTGKWWLDLTIVGAFNELRNTAALTANMGANLLGIIGEAHDLVVESADKFGARIGISNSGNIQDFVQFSEIYFMANASQWSSAVSQLKGYLVPAMENAGVGALNAYRNSPLASESGHIGSVSAEEKSKYIYEASTKQYRNVETGQFISPKKLPWGTNHGFDGTPVDTSISPGTIMDRVGNLNGEYAASFGSSMSERGLPPGCEFREHFLLRVLKPFVIPTGKAAGVKEFAAKGGAIQYYFKGGIQKWIDLGYIKVIKR